LWAESGSMLGARSCARFLVHSRFRNRPKVKELQSQLEMQLWDVRDEETHRLVESFARRPEPLVDPPPVPTMLVVVHGTWASGEDWWRWKSPFTMYLDLFSRGAVYKGNDAFSWSGGNGDDDRRAGADALVRWVDAHPAGELTIVAHSHGGNVVFLATRQGLGVNRLILLGSPMRTDYTPDIRKIDLAYNIYSFGDHVQTPAGTFPHRRAEGRTANDSVRSVNVLAHEQSPSHSGLHDESVWAANKLEQLLE
jgi:pimeloyl-ACP methyl ester carboxylesterase